MAEWIKAFRGMRESVNTGEVIKAYIYECSNCGYITGNQGEDFNYCPICGEKKVNDDGTKAD